MINHVNKKRKLSHSESRLAQAYSDDASTSSSESGGIGSPHAFQVSLSQNITRTGAEASKHAVTHGFPAFGPNEGPGTSLVQMQVDQLLADMSERRNRLGKVVDQSVKRLEQIIHAIPSRDSIPAREARKFLHQVYGKNILLPQDGPDVDAKYTFSFRKPAGIFTVAGHTLHTSLQSEETESIETVIVMPSSIFQSKDYKHFRYLHKRAYYLASIISALHKERGADFEVHYDYEDDCHLRPIILLTPQANGGVLNESLSSPFLIGKGGQQEPTLRPKWQLRILTAVDGNIFPARKSSLWDDCLRSAPEASALSMPVLKPTPLYNSVLRAECSRMSYEKLLEDTCKRCPGYWDACRLGSLWLRQRGYKAGMRANGFGSYEFATVMALLLSAGGASGHSVLSAGHDSFQLLKGVLRYLAMRDLMKKPLAIGDDVDLRLQGPSKTPMLYDAIRGLNVLYKMSPWSYRSLVSDAQTTLNALGNTLNVGQQVEDAFISKIDRPVLRYDMIMRMSIPVCWISKPSESPFADRAMSFASKLYEVLLEGLNDRATLINLQHSEQHTLSEPSAYRHSSIIMIQLILNPENCNRLVDRGPSAEEKQAATAFRKFWGERAELRRYEDGGILESLVWSQSSLEGSVCEQIARHVIRRHLGESAEQDLTCIANGFHLPLYDHENQVHQYKPLYRPAFTAYEQLEKRIRAFEGIPLQVRRIAASCAQLRYASCVGKNHSLASRVPLDVLIQFEGSSRWPNSFHAIQRTKIAFLSKIGELLEQSTPGLRARVGLENTTMQPIQNLPFLETTSPDSSHLTFHLRIHHEQELAMLDHQLKDKSTSPQHRALVGSCIATYKRKFLHGPLHTQVVASLCTRYPFLSPSIRLFKTWCATHLLSAHLLPPEVLELLTIQCFVSPFPWSQPPASIRTGFLRTLSLIARWDWLREPLIINANGGMQPGERDAIQLRFDAWRQVDPGMNRITFFIASTMDPTGIAWTERAVEKVVAGRLQSLARAACQLVQDNGTDTNVKLLFTHMHEDYDFLIHLDETQIKRLQEPGANQKSLFKNLYARPNLQETSSMSFEPVDLFIKELSHVYRDSLLLFYNPLKPKAICGLWHPSASTPRAWKVGLGYSATPHHKSEDGLDKGEISQANLDFNNRGVLREIKSLGGDMVRNFEVHEHKHQS